MLASKLIPYFASHPATFVFQVSLPAENIMLNPANKKTDQNETGIGAAAYAIFDTEQFHCHTSTVLVDTIASVQGSNVGDIGVSEVLELPAKVPDILDSVVSKCVVNTAHI